VARPTSDRCSLVKRLMWPASGVGLQGSLRLALPASASVRSPVATRHRGATPLPTVRASPCLKRLAWRAHPIAQKSCASAIAAATSRGWVWSGVRSGVSACVHGWGRFKTTRVARRVVSRWVVERTITWIGRYRWLSKDYEYLTESSETMIYLAMSRLLLRRLARRARMAYPVRSDRA
jgi:hypothetical protein